MILPLEKLGKKDGMRLGPCDGCTEGDRDGLLVGKVVERLDGGVSTRIRG